MGTVHRITFRAVCGSLAIGAFYEIVVQRSSVDAAYAGGSMRLLADMGGGYCTKDFLSWKTMGMDPVIDEVIIALEPYLNCDNDDPDCVYLLTRHSGWPNRQRKWVRINEHDGQLWLSLT